MAVVVDVSLLGEQKSKTMITLEVHSAASLDLRKPCATRTALHRLFAAAIVSDQFRAILLGDPEKALANGYRGQAFALTEQEKKIIKTIHAESLADFAQKVNQALKDN
jgi:hypothetical protein